MMLRRMPREEYIQKGRIMQQTDDSLQNYQRSFRNIVPRMKRVDESLPNILRRKRVNIRIWFRDDLLSN
jgi:hypothetical protein